ncbi:hypothetical protein INT44_003591 [Umbelopsis vinacea]|uniref:Hexosyltransferase n=1 Tax=Umbelopsis vinacea TaxID=44442 RepID=A0A8H7PUL0_9FUNG|nr:hypothetical protein INT44_003591 [Umbelopsis vinacea]KAI9288917.1 hypothetical protein BC943DRAFT_315610 [Umbelopsis sp. AD052]
MRFVVLAFVLTSTIVYYAYLGYLLNLPNLGRPVVWQKYCDSHTPDVTTDPVNIFVGVLTMDTKFDRRQMIRDTYLMYKPDNVIFKFVLGRPRNDPEVIAKLEEEYHKYGDLMFLDIKENMNEGKTYEYFRYMAETYNTTGLDYVFKADDDSYIRLDRLELDMRNQKRQMLYWGYLVGDTFMGGECYGLSFDLVQWVSTSQTAQKYKSGHEDSQVQKWFKWASIDSSVHYAPRNCYIYDDPESDSVYARPLTTDARTIVVHNLKRNDRFMAIHQQLP